MIAAPVMSRDRARMLRALVAAGLTGPQIAARAGCSRALAYRVISGEAWRERPRTPARARRRREETAATRPRLDAWITARRCA